MFAKLSLRAFDPLFLIFLRITIAALVFALILGYQKKLLHSLRVIKKHIGKFILLGLVGVGAAMIVGFIGLKSTTVIHYDLLFNASAVTMVVFSFLMLKERVRRVDAVLFLVALVGVLFIITNGNFTLAAFQGGAFWGDVLVLISSVGWGLYSVLGVYFAKRHQELTPMIIIFGSLVTAILFYLPYVLWGAAPRVVGNVDFTAVASTIALGVFSTAILFYLWIKFFQEKGGVWGGFISLAENITGVIFPIIFLGEHLTLAVFIGGVLVVVAILFKEFSEKKHQHTPLEI